jgi:8-oxo-dGTP diphosphatase
MIKVGVGVMILKDGKVLLGKRRNAHGAGEYAFPGGHLEFGESIFDCARRETIEEAGIEIKNIKFLFFSNLTQYNGKHYANIEVVSEWKSGKPKIAEPDKFEGWGWYPLDKLPKPLFITAPMSVEAYKTGKNFFDSKKS